MRGRVRARALVVAVVAVAAGAEVFAPPLAIRSFGGSVEMEPYLVRPPSDLIALYRATQHGAVLDVPFGFKPGRFFEMADDVLLSAYHHRPVAACYNSFKLPIQDEIQAIADRLPRDARAAEALHALGFRSVVVDELRAMKRRAGGLYKLTPDPPRLVMLARAAMHTAYSVQSTTPVIANFNALAIAAESAEPAAVGAEGAEPAGVAAEGAAPAGVAAAPGTARDDETQSLMPVVVERDTVAPEAPVALRFRNATTATYRHPPPIAPTALIARWSSAAGGAHEYRVFALLPLALAAGEESLRPITVPVPPAPGQYELTIAPAATPDLVLAKRRVQVVPPVPAEGPS